MEISTEGVRKAIATVVSEREARRLKYEDDQRVQYTKVKEMNQVLDYLRWVEHLLSLGGEEQDFVSDAKSSRKSNKL